MQLTEERGERKVKFDLDKEAVREMGTTEDGRATAGRPTTSSCCIGCDTSEASFCRGRSGCAA